MDEGLTTAAVAEINVTPMIDVLLSLLIIFMVASPPPPKHQQPIAIPQDPVEQTPDDPDATLLVKIDAEGNVSIGKKPRYPARSTSAPTPTPNLSNVISHRHGMENVGRVIGWMWFITAIRTDTTRTSYGPMHGLTATMSSDRSISIGLTLSSSGSSSPVMSTHRAAPTELSR